MKILESILDNVDSNFRNSSEELSSSPSEEFIPWGTEFSVDDYNIKISIHLAFAYNLDEIDEDNLKNNLADKFSQLCEAANYIDYRSEFQFGKRSLRTYAFAVAFKLSEKITPVQFLTLNIIVYNIAKSLKRCRKNFSICYPFEYHQRTDWNIAKNFEVDNQSALAMLDYMQWRVHEAFSLYVYNFVKRPEDDRSFEDERVSHEWLKRVAKKFNQKLIEDQFRDYI